MRLLKYFVIFLCLALPLVSIFYKTEIQGLSFTPLQSSDEWNIQVTYNLVDYPADQSFPPLPLVPEAYNQTVTGKEVRLHGAVIQTNELDTELNINRAELGTSQKANFLSKVKLGPSTRGQVMSSAESITLSRREMQKYLSLADLDEEDLEEIKSLSSKILDIKEDSKETTLRKIYLYVTEETLRNDEVTSTSQLLLLKEGSELSRALLATYLARVNEIPSRVMTALEIQTKKGQLDTEPRYIPEVFIDGRWSPLSINQTTYRRIPGSTAIINRDYEQVQELFDLNAIKITVAPIMLNRVDSALYSKKIDKSNHVLSSFSLYELPPSMRVVFYSILLIPLGTVVLSFSRNVIGVQTFGIFTPILISLFFLETSLLAGLIFFSFIVFLGFIQRYLLEKFYLLAVPRLSILLTTVIIIYTILTIAFYKNEAGMFSTQTGLGYFPIVIITIFIERFSVLLAEEGLKNTLKSLVGTFLISTLCYFIFKDHFLRLVVFNHPELLLSIIGINLIIGSYKGYRFSEILRFKELIKTQRNA